VNTLAAAVQLARQAWSSSPDSDPAFIFARALKAFEVTTSRTLSRPDLDGAFALWWTQAQPTLPAGTDREESRLLFLDAFAKVRAPLGSNPLAEAIRRADADPAPKEAARYPGSPRLQHLVAVCFHLQRLSGDCPFFLGARDAARVMGTLNPHLGLAALNGFVADGILTLVQKGAPGGRKASRYRFAGFPSPQPPA